jgi:hypothetical protein
MVREMCLARLVKRAYEDMLEACWTARASVLGNLLVEGCCL